MKLYLTPFTVNPLRCSGPSSDAGVETLSQAEALFGTPLQSRGNYRIFGEGNDRVIIGPTPFCVDPAGTNL